MKRILVGVDGSKESREAVRLAAELARATQSLLVIASAVPPPIPVEGALELIVQEQEWERKELEQANELVKEVAASIGEGVKVETLVVSGAPAIALADLAQSGEVELVVVGHRGRNAVARALLGSVADRLVQISPKPVLVVR
jgi:nucleotide-binding universal stress UspA family protein